MIHSLCNFRGPHGKQRLWCRSVMLYLVHNVFILCEDHIAKSIQLYVLVYYVVYLRASLCLIDESLIGQVMSHDKCNLVQWSFVELSTRLFQFEDQFVLMASDQMSLHCECPNAMCLMAGASVPEASSYSMSFHVPWNLQHEQAALWLSHQGLNCLPCSLVNYWKDIREIKSQAWALQPWWIMVPSVITLISMTLRPFLVGPPDYFTRFNLKLRSPVRVVAGFLTCTGQWPRYVRALLC